MLNNLQALRAIAAVGVVTFHFGLMPATLLPFKIGASGVDLFFVLSGFIIAHSSARSDRHFLAHRLIRVIPAYWTATIIAALVTLQGLDVPTAFGWLLQSLFYLPGPGGRPALIFVAWTLVFELAFYLLYWVALRFGKNRAPGIAIVALLALALVPLPRTSGPWPLLIEFAMGISIYLLAERRAALRPTKAGGLLIAAIGLGLLLVLPRLTGYNPDDYENVLRVLCWGLPAGLIIFGLVILEHAGIALRNRTILLLGAASYSIYLLHPIAIGQLMQIPANVPPRSWAFCAIAVGASIAASVAFHHLIELPLLTRMRRFLRDAPPIEQRV